jgi:uncharacterized protein (TIGR00369 family)
METLIPHNPDYARALREYVEPMPVFGTFGLTFVSIAPGAVVLEMPFRDELSFAPGYLQAGPIAALLDFAASFSCFTMVPAGWVCRALDLDVKYVGSTQGERFRAAGKVSSVGRSISFADARVYAVRGESESLAATGAVTIRNFQGK